MQMLCPDLVGRDGPVASLSAALIRAQAGTGGVTLLSGPAGVGKTRLVEHLASTARDRGMRVLRGRTIDSVVPMGYRPFAEALTAAVRLFGPPEDFAAFKPILAGLVPQWGRDRPTTRPCRCSWPRACCDSCATWVPEAARCW
jgi:AAA ATPase-like protein